MLTAKRFAAWLLLQTAAAAGGSCSIGAEVCSARQAVQDDVMLMQMQSVLHTKAFPNKPAGHDVKEENTEPPGHHDQLSPEKGKKDDLSPEDEELKTKFEEEQEVNEKRNPVSGTLALSLLAVVIIIMLTFHMVNSKRKAIVHGTWNVIGGMLSIYSAIMIFQYYKVVFVEFSREQQFELSADVPEGKMIFWCGFRALLGMLIQWALLWFSRHSHMSSKACAVLGGHTVGFILIDFWGSIQQTAVFRTSVFSVGSVAVIAAALMGSSLYFFSMARPKVMKALGLDETEAEAHGSRDAGAHGHGHGHGHMSATQHFLVECSASEAEAASLCLGRIFDQTIEFACCGMLAKLENVPKGKTADEVNAMFFSCLAMFILMMGLVQVRSHLHGKSYDHGVVFAVDVIKMTLAWSLLYWTKWCFWFMTDNQGIAPGRGDVLFGREAMFAFWYIPAFAAVASLAIAKDHNFIGVQKMVYCISLLGILLGLLWETAVDAAFDELGELMRPLAKHLVIIFIMAMVIPSFILHILPSAAEAEHFQEEMMEGVEEEKEEDIKKVVEAH